MKTNARIAIIGRPNVGKSTLFNRLLGRRRALVHDLPGVTRDRNEQNAKWWIRAQPWDVVLVDTGGVGGDHFSDEIDEQVETALSEADAALLVLDGQTGLLPPDRELLQKLRQSGVEKKIPVFGIVNKVDAEQHESMISDFYAAGLTTLLTISAEHGRGIDDLQEALAAVLPDESKDESQDELQKESQKESGDEFSEELINELPNEFTEELSENSSAEAEVITPPKIAILGRPNVGKSTLVNAILGRKRMITSPIAGTTVDAVDSPAELGGRPVVLIDTAGIRRKSKTEQGVEVLSVVQARKALERADVTLLMIDGDSGITDQDEKIGGLIDEAGRSVVIVVNKWDLQKKNPDFTQEMAAQHLRDQMGFLKFAPIVFMSAKNGTGFEDLGGLIEEILHQRKLKIPTHEFTEWVRKEITIHNPQNAKFYLCHQTSRNPPTFVCHVNDPERVHFSLRRHLVNGLRNRWGYMGTPVRLLIVEGKNRRSLPKPKPSPRK